MPSITHSQYCCNIHLISVVVHPQTTLRSSPAPLLGSVVPMSIQPTSGEPRMSRTCPSGVCYHTTCAILIVVPDRLTALRSSAAPLLGSVVPSFIQPTSGEPRISRTCSSGVCHNTTCAISVFVPQRLTALRSSFSPLLGSMLPSFIQPNSSEPRKSRKCPLGVWHHTTCAISVVVHQRLTALRSSAAPLLGSMVPSFIQPTFSQPRMSRTCPSGVCHLCYQENAAWNRSAHCQKKKKRRRTCDVTRP